VPSPEGSTKIIYDDEVVGFGLRVTPNGAKTFILRYRNARGAERKMKIGAFPAWDAGSAREQAKDLYKTKINLGIDPLEEREAAREALTVGEVLDAYLKSAHFAGKAESTRAIDKGRLERHIRPLLGKKVVEELTHDQVARAFADIRDGKTAVGKVKTKRRGLARVTGGEGTARAAIRLFRAVLSWAVTEKKITENPAMGVKIGKDGVRELLLSPAEYVSMFEAVDKLAAAGRIKASEADVVRLIALTGARRGEILGLRREHVNQKMARIELPPSRHKTGKATGERRLIDLPEEALAIIDRQPAGEVVFPIDPAGMTKAWNAVRAEAKLPANFGLHGLRHSVASHMAMGGAGASEIMTALGHKQLSTAQRYIHMADESRKRIALKAAGPALAALRR
jgi:integrase